jgi:hypothetical protein
MPLDHAALTGHIAQLERRRDSRVLVLAASNLDMDLLPALYRECRALGPLRRLDVVLHGRGGVVHAARRIALLLREQAEHLAFLVPYHCESSATLLTLCADEIVAGDLALFSPIDPHLHGTDGSAFSALDIRAFGDMAEQWFGLDAATAREQALALLCQSVVPPSLGSFYRSTLEMAQIAEELLAFQLGGRDAAFRQQLVRQLMSGYHSHGYPITRAEMAGLGLRMARDAEAERLSWEISLLIQGHVGGGLRASPEEPWHDAMLATRDGVATRRAARGGLAPQWLQEDAAC